MIRGQVNAARQAVLPLSLRGFNGQVEDAEAILDTGFDDFLTVSPDLAARLQLPFMMTRFYELGDGNEVEFSVHRITILWDGQDYTTEALVTDGGVLVSMSLLQGYHVFMDVVDGGEVRLQRRP